MTILFYILGYLAVAGFICMAYLKIRSYMAASPLHVRWELYPVPHEGSKTVYGGSFMEEKDWWTQPRHISHWGDIKALLTEVLFLHATFEHNIKLWVRSYPFHVGMYMLMGGTIIVLCAAFAQLFGLNPQGGMMLFVGNVINAMVLVGTLTTPAIVWPSALAWRSAASVSAVSPDWLMNSASPPSSITGSRYRNSDATSRSTGTRANCSNQYLATIPA